MKIILSVCKYRQQTSASKFYSHQLMHFFIQLWISLLTLILLMWRIWWALNNASTWQMGFNSAFKRLKLVNEIILYYDARSNKHQITLCKTFVLSHSSYPKDFADLIALYLARNLDLVNKSAYTQFDIGTVLLKFRYILMPDKLYHLTTAACLCLDPSYWWFLKICLCKEISNHEYEGAPITLCL